MFNFEMNGISFDLGGNTVNIGGVTNIVTPPPKTGDETMKNFVASLLGAVMDVHDEPEKVIEAIAADTGMITTRDKSQAKPIPALKPIPLSDSKVFKFIKNALFVNDGDVNKTEVKGNKQYSEEFDDLNLATVNWQQVIIDVITFLSKFGGIENATDNDAQASYYDDIGDHILARCGASSLAEDVLTTPLEIIWSYMGTFNDLPKLREKGLQWMNHADRVGRSLAAKAENR